MQGYSVEKKCEFCGGRIYVLYGKNIQGEAEEYRQEQCVNDCFILDIKHIEDYHTDLVIGAVYFPFKYYKRAYNRLLTKQQRKDVQYLYHVNNLVLHHNREWRNIYVERQSERLYQTLIQLMKNIQKAVS